MKDRWQLVCDELSIDVAKLGISKPIAAADVERITQKQPRLMASFDESKQLPRLFRGENGNHVLPYAISRDAYRLGRGRGFHQLEELGAAETFRVRYPFKLLGAADKTPGETEYVIRALNSELLNHFTGIKRLFQLRSGKASTHAFWFNLGAAGRIDVDRAQFELDAAYQGERDVLLMEAKTWRTPEDFNVRKLYYPYRFWHNKAGGLRVRPIFLNGFPQTGDIGIWEYEFTDHDDLTSIRLVESGRFSIVEEEPPMEEFEAVEPRALDYVPQADSAWRWVEFPILVSHGIDNAAKWAAHYGISTRQANYYREAAEALGLVTMDGTQYKLTPDGRTYTRLPPRDRADFLTKKVLELGFVHLVFQRILKAGRAGLSVPEIEALVAKNTRFTGSTVHRRATSVFAWFKWLGEHSGLVLHKGGRLYGRDALPSLLH